MTQHDDLTPSSWIEILSRRLGLPSERLRKQARSALEQRRFDLAAEVLQADTVDTQALIENLLIYQAELEVQNDELVSAQRETQDALARFSALFEGLPIAALVIDRHGLVLEANLSAERLFGLKPSALRRHFFARLIEESDRGPVIGALSECTGEQTLQLSAVHFNGSAPGGFIGDLHIAALPGTRERSAQRVCVILDRSEAIRQHEAIVASHEQYRVLADYSPDWEYWLAPSGAYRYISPACATLTGYSAEALAQHPDLLDSLIHPEDLPRWQAHRRALAAPERAECTRFELRLRERGGAERWLEHVCKAVHTEDGRYLGLRGVFRDITPLKRSEEQLVFLANHDALTGLPNRSVLHLRLGHAIAHAARHGRQIGILFLDLDRFKVVNDTLGHPVGDALLQATAQMLSQVARAEDTVARLSGDEFVIVLEEVDAPQSVAGFAERLLARFTQPLDAEGHALIVTASVGISVYPQDGSDIETLLQHADIAMYAAKSQGRNACRFYSPEMAAGVAERLQLEQALRGALERQELQVHYQPQVDLRDGSLQGVEALCRWDHPELGPIPPSTFIPLAEDMGLIDTLGAWVLEAGCRQLRRWDELGFHVPRLAVNLSMLEIEATDLLARIEAILTRTGISPARLELEVTESMIMRRTESAIAALGALRAWGITIAVDDFGTGYSSLAYLKHLPLNRLKIDRSFVTQLADDRDDAAIVSAIIAMGKRLGLALIAEGVESQQQADLLLADGCLEAQGYRFGRPVSADALQKTWASA